MKTTAKERYGGLDVFRVIAAVLVIANDTSPLLSVNSDADFFLTRILARIAVPFFLMVTGQFVVSPALFHTETDMRKLWRYIKKAAYIYAVSILLYIPLGLYAGHYQGLTAKAALRMLVFDGTFYHLWYFPACITGVLLVYLLSRFLRFKTIAFISALLYMIGLFGDSYFGLIRDMPVLSSAYNFGFQIFSYTRNGLFLAPAFLVMGAAIGQKPRSGRPHKNAVGLFISLVLMTAEAFILRRYNIQRHDSMYIFLLPAMVFLYRLILSWKVISRRLLKTVSMLMYILHPAVIVLVRGAAKHMHMTHIFVDNSVMLFLSVSILTVLISAALSLLFIRTGEKPFCSGRAWIELSRSALQSNVRTLKKLLPETCELMPAVKANAYGHGAALMAKELNRMGIHSFCVACVSEGVELRQHGVKGEILILGYTHPEDFSLLHRYRLTQTVIDFPYAVLLNRCGKRLHVHVGIDTGMHRLGERSENIQELCSIFQMKNLIIDGLFTHLCAADSSGKQERAFTDLQAQAFYHVACELKRLGYSCPKLHLQSSYGVFNYPELAEDYARVGIALYGVLSTGEDTQNLGNALLPVLSLKARIATVRTLYDGECVGYGMQFTAAHDMKIATLSIGYADGLPRALSNGGAVLINGCEAPIIGRICMDQTIVDVTDIPGVRPGDIAVLIGRSGDREISVCDLAARTGTITNEILSRLGARLERSVVY